MNATATIRARRDDTRLLVVDPQSDRTHAGSITELPHWLEPSDLLVLNDAATLPASLSAKTSAGAEIELRLLGPIRGRCVQAAVLGAGDFHTRTEHRPAPPPLRLNEVLEIGTELRARVVAHSQLSNRLVDLEFDVQDAQLMAAIYRRGRPVQYAHQPEVLPLYSVQTVYAGRPWSSEMPSAGRPLSWATLTALKRRGVEIAYLTHAAGLSAVGDPAIDAALPLPERYDIPVTTVAAVQRARAQHKRVIAVGTSVVRALEGSARNHSGVLTAGTGITDLRIDAAHELRFVSGLLTGVHTPEESHHALLQAFAAPHTLRAALAHAQALGYLTHEHGDACLFLSGTLPALVRDHAA